MPPDNDEPRVLRVAPLTQEEGGVLKWLRIGSLIAGAPTYERDETLERLAMTSWHPDIPVAYRDQIVTGDAREIAKRIPDRSIDLIFTDPVYENTDDYAWLAQEAKRVLKPDRSCLVWCSNVGQYEVKPVMSEYLTFILPLTYTKVAKAHKAFGYKTFLWTTPCLWFLRGTSHSNHEWLVDTVVDHSNAIISTATPPKDSYKWHKNPEAYVKWLTSFARPGAVVWDPFTGSGSLPVECKKHGYHFLASEINPDVAEAARRRLADVQVIDQRFVVEQPALF